MNAEGNGGRLQPAGGSFSAPPRYEPEPLAAGTLVAGALMAVAYTCLFDWLAWALSSFCVFGPCAPRSPVGYMVVITVIGFVLVTLHVQAAAGLRQGRPAARRVGVALGVLWLLACGLPAVMNDFRYATGLLIPGALVGLVIVLACRHPLVERTDVR